jgi:hypothetical protein
LQDRIFELVYEATQDRSEAERAVQDLLIAIEQKKAAQNGF